MKFEWDPDKSESNRKKHGIDFQAATDLWTDERRVEIHAPHPVESRRIIISRLKGKLWTAVYTVRNNAVRIISVRSSRQKEVKLYEKEKTG